jgi:antitoxin HicB
MGIVWGRASRPSEPSVTSAAARPVCEARLGLTGLREQVSIGSMARYRYNIMLRPEPEGGYTALVPALPGCVTYGRTLEEAREMAKDAISGYVASLRKHKDPIPTDDNTLVASLDLEYAEATRR